MSGMGRKEQQTFWGFGSTSSLGNLAVRSTLWGSLLSILTIFRKIVKFGLVKTKSIYSYIILSIFVCL